ncbi:MAG: hypothetical protein JSS69_09970 [Acidobacteria bacterium]|nr:hypothetical protein [Acidobacteriota bacterium]MBS1866229.1 hypothetical protein [Acidobacteriota bacterium]
MILAKIALGAVGTLAVATVYTFREGTIRVDVDEHRQGGSHVHFWVPAAAVPAALHFVPDDKLQEAADRAREALPIAEVVAEELEKYPNVEFVSVDSQEEHVKISVRDGKVYVDVRDHEDDVHVAVPVSTIRDVVESVANRKQTQ